MAENRTWLSKAAIAGALVVACLVPFLAPPYYLQFGAKVMLMGVLALSLNLLVGHGGLVSLCQAAFFGLSGYVLALLSPADSGASLWTSLPLAMGAVAMVAAAIGALSLKTRGIYFIMVTLAFGEMLFYLFHDTGIGGGSDGIYIYFEPEVSIAGYRLIDLGNKTTFYLVSLAVLIATILLMRGLLNSPFGRALAAAKDNEQRALSLGFPVFRIRLAAFILSAVIASVAGYLSAVQFGVVAPQLLGWHLSATVLVMVVLGGLNSLWGPLLGAVALMGLEEVLQSAFDNWKLVKGLLIILAVFALPGGLRQLAELIALPKQPAAAADETARLAALDRTDARV